MAAAAASLTRMTVPLASNDSASNQGLLMPKLKYRFRVVFENFGAAGSAVPTTELTKQVIDFTRPKVGFEDIAVPVYNSTLYYAGKYTWEMITCNLRDDASGQIARLVGAQVQKQLDFFEQASAASGIDYKFTTRFEVLDGGNGKVTPVPLETWELYGCYLQNVDYGDANYGDSNPMTIALSIRFDNALQTPLETGGIGQTVARTVNNVLSGSGQAA